MSTKFTNDMWRMPRNANQSKSSNYSWNYSVNAKFNISSPANAGITSSISFWFKRAVVTSVSQPYEINGSYGMWMSNTTMYIKYGSSGYQTVDSATGLTQDGLNALTSTDWVHWVLIREATATSTAQNFKMYANTKEVFSSSSPSNFGTNNTEVDMIWATNQSQSTSIDSFSVFNYALSPSQITTLYGSSSIGIGNPMSLSPKPVAYYSLGEYEAYNGANYLTPNDSLKDYVFDFVPNAHIAVAASTDFNFGTGDFTISTWINVDSFGSFPYLFDFRDSPPASSAPNNNVITCYIETPSNRISIYAGGAVIIDGSAVGTALSAGIWYNIIIKRNSGTVTTHINGGSADASGTFTRDMSTTPKLNIGAKYDGSNGLDSKFSNFQIFNTALSSTEITTLYNYGSPIITLANIPQNSNLKAWYKLDASEIYNSTSTEWSIDNNQNPSAYASSLDFDGTNGYIQIPNLSTINTSGNVSISFWMKTSNTTTTQSPVRLQGSTIGFYMYSDGLVRMYGSSTGRLDSSIASNDGEWHLVVGVYGTSAQKLYIDNVVTASDVGFQGTIGTTGGAIGSRYFSSANTLFDGQISNCSVWNTALSSSQITEIYNNGTPSNLLSHSATSNLVSWWKLNNTTTGIQDSKGSNNGTNNGATEYPGFVNTLVGDSSGMTQANLVQSDLSFTSGYSPYALDFDGANDRIISGSNSGFTINDARTFSAWIKTTDTGNHKSIVQVGPDYNNNQNFELSTFGGFLHFSSWTTYNFTGNVSISDGNWHFVCITFNGSVINGYVDGVSAGPNLTNASVSLATTNTPYYIGGSATGMSSKYLNGSISNVSVWNTALTSAQVTEIYNEGVPSNLNNHSAYSNLVSWWQLGSNSSFNTNWTVLDEKGSNNGTSSNMGEDAIVDGVGSYANAVSVGLSALTYLAGEAPYSTANAKSINMGVTARGTDVPPSPPPLLLNTYTGSQAAYSLRRLSNSYTGNLIRVTKKVSNVISTTDIGYNSSNELDTTALATFASGADNGEVRVDIWYDQSGNGNNATQSTFIECPYIYQSGSLITENSKPAIKNGATLSLTTSGTPFSSLQSSAFVVNKLIPTTTYHLLLYIGNNTPTETGYRLFQNNASNYAMIQAFGSTNFLTSTTGDLNLHNLASFYNDSNTLYYRYNGASNTSISVTPSAYTTDIKIGKNLHNSNQNWAGTYQEFIFYPSNQSSNLTGIETNIKNYYGI